MTALCLTRPVSVSWSHYNSESSESLNSLSNCSMYLVYFILFLRFSFSFNDAYLIVSFLTVPFMISHYVFEFASVSIVAISLMLSIIVF